MYLGPSTVKTLDGYDVLLEGEKIGELRRPTGNVFASDSTRYWDAYDLEGRKRGTGSNLSTASAILAKEAQR